MSPLCFRTFHAQKNNKKISTRKKIKRLTRGSRKHRTICHRSRSCTDWSPEAFCMQRRRNIPGGNSCHLSLSESETIKEQVVKPVYGANSCIASLCLQCATKVDWVTFAYATNMLCRYKAPKQELSLTTGISWTFVLTLYRYNTRENKQIELQCSVKRRKDKH